MSSWVELLSLEDLSGEARTMAESGEAQYGQLLETWRAMFHRPGIFAAYLPFLRAVAGPGTVDPKLKDLSALLVGELNGCRYTVSHRATSAGRNGATEHEIVTAASGEWHSFDDATRAALTFTRHLTEDPTRVSWAAQPQLVEPAVREELERHFNDAQLVELSLSIAVWNALARFHRVMGFDLDMPAPPATIDPAHPTP